MATLHIQEYRQIAKDANNRFAPVGREPAEASQAVTYTTSTQSAAFGASSNLIRVIADADAYLVFGADPTATTAGLLIKADTPEYFGVAPGDKVAAYDGTS